MPIRRARSKRSMGAKEAKVAKVMREFQRGRLRSSSGKKVRSRRQALAIALSEAGMVRRGKGRRRGRGKK